MKEIMTREEAAEYIGISVKTFSTKVQPKIKIIKLGKCIRIRKIDLDEYLKSISEVQV